MTRGDSQGRHQTPLDDVRALVFDFDGLIMDTESCVAASWQSEWRHYGLDVDLADVQTDHSSLVTAERYETLARRVGHGYDQRASHQRRIKERDRLLDDLAECPGVDAWLTAAEGVGLRLAIASSSRRAPAMRLLRRIGWDGRFETTVFRDDVSAPKPDPATYVLALQRLRVSAAHAVAFEDSPQGVTAASRAGLRCVAVPNPLVTTDQVSHADLLLASAASLKLDQVLRILSPSR